MNSYALKRSLTARVFGGVAGGVGAYLGLNGWWVRAVFIALTLTDAGFGVLLYLFLWIIVPAQSIRDLPPILLPGEVMPARYTRPEGLLILGAVAVIIGVIVLAETTGALQSVGGDLLAPLMLVLIAVTTLLKQIRRVA